VGYNAAASGKDMRNMSGVALRARSQASQTELAPMFSVLKHLDIRVYRKVWNRIKQYWKAEMWIRVTDDERNLQWVGLNKPITKGEQMLQQAQAQMMSQQMPPEQMQPALAHLQQQIAADPTMKEVVDTHNDIANLDVDIVMDDAPDTVTQEVEDFQAMAEMVKSGFPMPPEAVIMSSPLANKDKILKMMKEKPQIPPELQKQMQQMQEQVQKLTQENQTLKSGQQEAAAKMQADAAAGQQKLAAHLQESQAKTAAHERETQAKLNLDEAVARRTMALEQERAANDRAIESQRAAHQRELDRENAARAEDTELRKAALDAATKIEVARINATKDAAANVAPNEGTQANDIMKQILETQTKLLEKHAAPKKISITHSDGRTASATVQ
jgi:septal ring factor EnvC (AmiA/AmiB activator)